MVSFAGTAAHQLAEPLIITESSAILVADELGAELDPELRDRLDAISRSAARARRLMHALLEDARASTESLELRRVAVGDVVEDSIAAFRPRIEQQRAVVEAGPLPGVLADPGLLAVVFDNLLSNALKHGPRDGNLIRVSAAPDPEGWRIAVESGGAPPRPAGRGGAPPRRGGARRSRRLMHAGSSSPMCGCPASGVSPAAGSGSPSACGSSSAWAADWASTLAVTRATRSGSSCPPRLGDGCASRTAAAALMGYGTFSSRRSRARIERESMTGRPGLSLAVLDSDTGFLQVLANRLEAAGWQHRVLAGPVPIEALVSMRLNVLVVDLAVLGPAGWSYLEKVCDRLPSLGVVVCTGRSSVSQRVRGLRLGADDWITKPCHPEELIARAEAVARRRRRAEAARVEVGPVVAGGLEVRADQVPALVRRASVALTRREFELIQLLADVEGQVLPREEIYQRVWGYAMVHGDRSVDVFVRKLRQKLERASPRWRYIHTHFGIGYRFAAESLDPAPAPAVETLAHETVEVEALA